MKRMQRFLTSVAIVVLVALSGHYLYRDRKLKDLSETGSKVRPSTSDPKRSTPSKVTASGISRRSSPRPRATPPNQETDEATLPKKPSPNQVPNRELARVLLQILAAQNLADGIWIGVTDEHVQVAGELDSEEKKRQLLKILNGGREARRIDTTGLIIRD